MTTINFSVDGVQYTVGENNNRVLYNELTRFLARSKRTSVCVRMASLKGGMIRFELLPEVSVTAQLGRDLLLMYDGNRINPMDTPNSLVIGSIAWELLMMNKD